MSETYLITDDDGEPLGVADMDQITDVATHLAFDMAANSNNRKALDRIAEDTLTKVGTDTFGYVCAAALRIMTTEILSPSFDLAKVYGTDLREGIRAIAEGRQP